MCSGHPQLSHDPLRRWRECVGSHTLCITIYVSHQHASKTHEVEIRRVGEGGWGGAHVCPRRPPGSNAAPRTRHMHPPSAPLHQPAFRRTQLQCIPEKVLEDGAPPADATAAASSLRWALYEANGRRLGARGGDGEASCWEGVMRLWCPHTAHTATPRVAPKGRHTPSFCYGSLKSTTCSLDAPLK